MLLEPVLVQDPRREIDPEQLEEQMAAGARWVKRAGSSWGLRLRVWGR